MTSGEKMNEQKLLARIEFGEHKAEFSGDFDAVSREIMKFLFDMSPTLSTLSKIKLEVNFEQLVRSLQGIMKIAKEGVLLLVSRERLIGPELICLHLIGAYVGYKLGILEKETLSVDELSRLTGIRRAVVSVRLTELAHNRIVASTEPGERKITSIGIEYFRSTILPKIQTE